MIGIGSIGAYESGLTLIIWKDGDLVITGIPIKEKERKNGLQAVPTFHQ